ncbi:hypothetical protein BJX64DRAFT_49551 [Aspergillus heterothallicus]
MDRSEAWRSGIPRSEVRLRWCNRQLSRCHKYPPMNQPRRPHRPDPESGVRLEQVLDLGPLIAHYSVFRFPRGGCLTTSSILWGPPTKKRNDKKGERKV